MLFAKEWLFRAMVKRYMYALYIGSHNDYFVSGNGVRKGKFGD